MQKELPEFPADKLSEEDMQWFNGKGAIGWGFMMQKILSNEKLDGDIWDMIKTRAFENINDIHDVGELRKILKNRNDEMARKTLN